MAQKNRDFEDLKTAKNAYLEALMKIEDNPRITKSKKEETAKMIQETRIHEQIVLESIQM